MAFQIGLQQRFQTVDNGTLRLEFGRNKDWELCFHGFNPNDGTLKFRSNLSTFESSFLPGSPTLVSNTISLSQESP